MRYRVKYKLQFKKNGSTHTSVNTFWGDTPKECAWHKDIVVDTWLSAGWELTIEEKLEEKTF